MLKTNKEKLLYLKYVCRYNISVYIYSLTINILFLASL